MHTPQQPCSRAHVYWAVGLRVAGLKRVWHGLRVIGAQPMRQLQLQRAGRCARSVVGALHTSPAPPHGCLPLQNLATCTSAAPWQTLGWCSRSPTPCCCCGAVQAFSLLPLPEHSGSPEDTQAQHRKPGRNTVEPAGRSGVRIRSRDCLAFISGRQPLVRGTAVWTDLQCLHSAGHNSAPTRPL